MNTLRRWQQATAWLTHALRTRAKTFRVDVYQASAIGWRQPNRTTYPNIYYVSFIVCTEPLGLVRVKTRQVNLNSAPLGLFRVEL